MKILFNDDPKISRNTIAFGIVLTILIPALLILENFKLFLLFILIQLGILALAFFDLSTSLILHAFLLLILAINTTRQLL